MTTIIPLPVADIFQCDSTIPPMRGGACFPTPWVWVGLGTQFEQENVDEVLSCSLRSLPCVNKPELARWMKKDMWPTHPVSPAYSQLTYLTGH